MASDNSLTVPARATKRSSIADDNVWEWIHHVSDTSPFQPIVNLGTGFVEYNPPDFLLDEHAKALSKVEGNQYAPVPGIQQLKNTISDIYSPLYKRRLDPSSEILITSGAQEGLLSCVMAFIDHGDEVILLEPVFEMYVFQTTFAGGVVKYVPLRPPPRAAFETVSGNDWTLDFQELESAITDRTRMIYINNPHNPLGKVFTRDELLGIGNLCVRYGLTLVSDEVYERVAFDEPMHCPNPVPHLRVASLSPEIAQHTLTAVSLGKLFNATGWRVGFVSGPQRLMKAVMSTHLVLAYSSSTPAQEACAVGLRIAEEKGWWKQNSTDIAKRCRVICDALDEIGLTSYNASDRPSDLFHEDGIEVKRDKSNLRPNGIINGQQYVAPASAWFIYININTVQIPDNYSFPTLVQRHGSKDWKVCYFLVQEFGISSIPGSCFYGLENAHMGAEYIRFGACKSEEGLKLARERLLLLKPHITKA